MCYWVGTKNVREKLLKQAGKDPEDEIPQLFYNTFLTDNQKEFKEYFIAIGKGKPVLTTLVKNNNKLQFKDMQWTLPYSYFDKKTNREITRELLNSTCERVFFQHKDIIYSKRCLVPIDGYFEYHHFKEETYPYFIYPSDDDLFYAGAIWNSSINKETGEVRDTFSIITVPPNRLITQIHNNPKAPNGPRMLLLMKKEKALEYLIESLTANDLKALFTPLDESTMKAHTVLRFQRKEYFEFLQTPKVREYFEYSELEF
jgi:putative SOS response-associated peptidase YedK